MNFKAIYDKCNLNESKQRALFEEIYFECNVKPLFEKILKEANEMNIYNQKWLNIREILRKNVKPLTIVEFNEQNYNDYLGGGEEYVKTGYNNVSVIMQTEKNDGFDFYVKLKTKKMRGLKAGRTILLDGIKETLENPILVISDHDENSHPATSYIRSYTYENDRKQTCNKPLKVLVTPKNIVVSAYFVDYDNIRDLILRGEEIKAVMGY